MLRSILLGCILIIMGCSKKVIHKCTSGCDLAGDEKENTTLLHLKLKNRLISGKSSTDTSFVFPLKINIVQLDSTVNKLDLLDIHNAIHQLNKAFEEVKFQFFIQEIAYIQSDLHLEDLSDKGYKVYNEFSALYDEPDIISLNLFIHDKEFCETKSNSVSCHKVGGFSYILSNRTSNIVVSKFDLLDKKLLTHEFGHFFGLYHTFEKDQFDKDDFALDNCDKKGDMICDTPPDPGGIYEVYVNYHTCEMNGLIDEYENEYKPMIENYMSYYKPCYMKPYRFSDGQIEVMKQAAMSDFRNKYTNK